MWRKICHRRKLICWRFKLWRIRLLWRRSILSQGRVQLLCIRCHYHYRRHRRDNNNQRWIYSLLLSMQIKENYHHIYGFFKDFVQWLILVLAFYLIVVYNQIVKQFLRYGHIYKHIRRHVVVYVDIWNLEFNHLMINLATDHRHKLNH